MKLNSEDPRGIGTITHLKASSSSIIGCVGFIKVGTSSNFAGILTELNLGKIVWNWAVCFTV